MYDKSKLKATVSGSARKFAPEPEKAPQNRDLWPARPTDEEIADGIINSLNSKPERGKKKVKKNNAGNEMVIEPKKKSKEKEPEREIVEIPEEEIIPIDEGSVDEEPEREEHEAQEHIEDVHSVEKDLWDDDYELPEPEEEKKPEPRIKRAESRKLGREITKEEERKIRKSPKATIIVRERIIGGEEEPKSYCLVDLSTGEVFDLEGTSSIGLLEDNDIVIDKRYISRHHAVIEIEDGKYYLKDTDSTNGTFSNGRKLDSDERVQLEDGDIITLANSDFEFREV